VLALTVRLLCSLAVVIGLLLLITRLSARRMRGSSDALVKVLERRALSRTSAVSVITVGERVLVIGTTEHEVRLLTELDADEIPDAHRAATPAPAPTPLRSRTPVATGALGGSVLSTQTWQQAYAAATGKAREGA
jgi:flagellar protein FliO/FliZ